MENYLSDNRVRYYRNEVNIGPIPNWKNLLYKYATGEYGKLICDDDYLIDNEHLKKSIDLILKENLEIVISGSLGRIEDEKGLIKEFAIDPDIPEITDVDWWLENGGKKVKGIYLFLNFNDGAVFSIKRAKELNAFMPDAFGLDYEILSRFVLSGRVGYLRGHHFVARAHPNNDGSSENFEKAFSGLEMFNRIYEFGLKLDLPESKLLKYKRRNIVVFSVIFLMDKWFLSKGISVKSIFDFKKLLSKYDKHVFLSVMTSSSTISSIIRNKNMKLYKFLKSALKK